MKLTPAKSSASAVAVVLALLGVVSLFVMANLRTLTRLKHDVKLIEQRQLQRLATLSAGPRATATTNAVGNIPAPGSTRNGAADPTP